jgi:hypothetical protein
MAGPQSAGGALRLKQCAVFADFGRNPADFGPPRAIGAAGGLAARPARRGRCGQHACLFLAALAAGKGVSQSVPGAEIGALGCFFFIYAPVPGSFFRKGLARIWKRQMATRPADANDGGDVGLELGEERDDRPLGCIIRDVVEIAYGFDGQGHQNTINNLTAHLECACALPPPSVCV